MEAHLAPGTAVFVIGEADLGAKGGGTLTDNGEPEMILYAMLAAEMIT